MKEKLTNNLGLKFLSITLAIFAWFMVVNVVNPLVVDSEEVPVEMINEDILSKANLTYDMVGKKTVTVTYEVRTRDRYKVSASDFYAYADLANLYDVTGSLCENCDKFAVDRMLPEVERGDLLVIHDTGAHGHAMGYNYNGKLRSAELLLREDGSVKLIRRAETPEDYFATAVW